MSLDESGFPIRTDVGAPDPIDGMGLREEKKELTRRALVNEAMSRFLSAGYHETTLEEIAAAVRVSMRTLFRYFDSKERLFFAWQEQALADFEHTLRARRATESVLAVWLRWTTRFSDLATRSPDLVRHNEIRAAVPALRAHWLVILRRYEQLLAEGFVEELGPEQHVVARMAAASVVAGSDEVGGAWLRGNMQADLASGDRRVVELCDELFGRFGIVVRGAER